MLLAAGSAAKEIPLQGNVSQPQRSQLSSPVSSQRAELTHGSQLAHCSGYAGGGIYFPSFCLSQEKYNTRAIQSKGEWWEVKEKERKCLV